MEIQEYLLELSLDKDSETFMGFLVINVKQNGESSITLDSVGLTYYEGILDEHHIKYEQTDEKITFTLPNIQKEPINIYVEYTGQLNTQMEGLYKTYFDKEKDLFGFCTQMESEECRKLFPCVDVPKAKANIQLTVNINEDWVVYGNMPIKSSFINGDTATYEFEKSNKMSTYLFALYAVPCNLIDYAKISNNIPAIGAILPKNTTAHLALKATARGVQKMGDILKYPFPLDKIDIAALPDFSSGAMENWGLITFRDIYILDDEGSTLDNQMTLIYVVLHELSHQWFGNLITLEKWRSLFMKEGFATWFGYFICEKLYPTLPFDRHFLENEVISALKDDYLEGTHPLEVGEECNLNEIYDGLTYSKGACLIHCLRHIIGEERLIRGLSEYVNKYEYQTTNPEQLFRCVTGDDDELYDQITKFITTIKYPICTVENGKISTDIPLIFPGIEVNGEIKTIDVEIQKGDIVNGHYYNYTRVKYSPYYFKAIIKRLDEFDQTELFVLWNDIIFFVKHDMYPVDYLMDSIEPFYKYMDAVNQQTLRSNVLNFFYLDNTPTWKLKWQEHLAKINDTLLLQRINLLDVKNIKVNNDDRKDTYCALSAHTKDGWKTLWDTYKSQKSLSSKEDIRMAICLTPLSNVNDILDIAFGSEVRDQDRYSLFSLLSRFNSDNFYDIMLPRLPQLLTIYSNKSALLTHIMESWACHVPQLLDSISSDIKIHHKAAIARGSSSREHNLKMRRNICNYFVL